ncbi:hypothetical protein AcV7_007468 [Taiwanofungus camphoratus]|nr:hypothetical protein AcV7_007468 [Antrodia cinnamomea]
MQRPALSTLPTQTPRPDPLRLLVSHAQSPATDAANALPCTRWSPRESRSHVRPRQSMPSVSAAVTRPGPTPAAGRPLRFSELPHVLPRSVHNSPSPSLFLSSFFLAHSCAHSDNAPPFLPPASALLQPTKLREPALPVLSAHRTSRSAPHADAVRCPAAIRASAPVRPFRTCGLHAPRRGLPAAIPRRASPITIVYNPSRIVPHATSHHTTHPLTGFARPYTP